MSEKGGSDKGMMREYVYTFRHKAPLFQKVDDNCEESESERER